MSKVSEYLNEHLQGEVTTNKNILRKLSTDGSVLTLVPEMVVYPRSTSDIRKVARFSWQLAEKGHKLPITPRGGGSDQTGAAIGTGIVIDMQSHMDKIFEIDIRQRLVRVQPGITFKALNEALKLQGLYVPSYPASQAYSTVGGAIANNASGVLSGKYGSTGAWVHQLEVVLANGEVIQTGRLSKRDVNKKKGQQNFEGEIYRNLDELLADNDKLLDSLAIDARDNVGYNVSDTRSKNGSLDLMPLIVGSQGTLGIISEVIMKAEQLNADPLIGAIAYPDYESARDGMDELRRYDPAVMELIDGRLFKEAIARGNKYQFYSDALDNLDSGEVAAVIYLEFDQASGRSKKKTAKKISNYYKKLPPYVVLEGKEEKSAYLRELMHVPSIVRFSDKSEVSAPAFLDGAFIPPERFEEFSNKLLDLEKKHHTELPLTGHIFQDVYYSYPMLDFRKVSDRQKVFKLLNDWSSLVHECGGHLIGEAGEGRLKAPFAYKNLEDDVKDLYNAVHEIFDPLDILNAGVKQTVELKSLTSNLRTDYDGSDFAHFGAPS